MTAASVKLVPCIVISSTTAAQVRGLALRDAHLRCSRVSQQPGAFEKSRPPRAAPRVSQRRLVEGARMETDSSWCQTRCCALVLRAPLALSVRRALQRVCARAASRPRKRQLHRPAARPARGRSNLTLVFPDRFHRASARAHPGRAPKRDARMATLPWPRVRIWASIDVSRL